MRSNTKNLKRSFAAALAAVVLMGSAAHAYGPLYIHDYTTGTPYRWDVSTPVQVYTDGGNFASGSVWVWVETPETCNPDDGWMCGYNEELYVEFTNEQGVARVDEALASWSSVQTSSFEAARAGSFADIGLGGTDGDSTGAPEEFNYNDDGDLVHEIIGSMNGGGIHVLFDEDGSVMANVMGAPYGVLGIATPEWANEETGEITEGWAVIGGAQTHYNDEGLAQMAGVITHELGHSFNLAHTQVNGHIVMYGGWAPVTPGPADCSAHWAIGGDYSLPFTQFPGPAPENMSVMYPFIDNYADPWSNPTGQYQATADTADDLAGISSLYPAASLATDKGTIKGTVTYAFSDNGVIGVNIVARNVDNPFDDAITAMTGDWNDGQPGAAQGVGEYIIEGLTPGARYVVHAENIYAGGFPTPQVSLPGPSEYYNGSSESDDATRDDACDYTAVVAGAGETVSNIDIQMNGMQKTPQLVILPAPNANNITENGKVTGGTIINNYGESLSWVRTGNDKKKGGTSNELYTILPMGGITLSDNGSVIAGRTGINGAYVPSRYTKAKGVELLPLAGNNACDQGGGIDEYYSHFAISPDGETMAGFLWNCDNEPGYQDFLASAVTYNDEDGWTVLHDHRDDSIVNWNGDKGTSSRVDAISDNGVAVGWVANSFGWWEGHVWNNGEEINLKDAAPANIVDVGQATAISADGLWVVGINVWDDLWNQRPYRYNTEAGEFEVLDIADPCPPWDWFCWGDKPFNPYDIADDGTLVGAFGTGPSSAAVIVSDALGGPITMVDFLKGQGVINAQDMGVVSNITKITSNGRHLAGWTGVDGDLVSFKLTLDQLWVCSKGKSQRVGYPGAVATHLSKGATLGMCEADLPLQYKLNY